MAEFFILQAVNLYLGDDVPDIDAAKHLKLQSLQLPTLEYASVDHLGGGASGEISISMNTLRKLEPSFKLAGFDEDAYRHFGIGSNKPQTYTAYGSIRSKQTGERVQAKALLRGSVGRVAPDAFDRQSMLGHDHSFHEVTLYSLTVGGKEWFHWNYWKTERRVMGTDELAEERQLLGLV